MFYWIHFTALTAVYLHPTKSFTGSIRSQVDKEKLDKRFDKCYKAFTVKNTG